ncbi:hypothetical protein MHI02_15675 [Oceanobacillus sp. FSL K6-0118]
MLKVESNSTVFRWYSLSTLSFDVHTLIMGQGLKSLSKRYQTMRRT